MVIAEIQRLCICIDCSPAELHQILKSLERMNAVVHFIKKSPKKLARFQTMMGEIEKRGENPRDKYVLRPLCPTLWGMRLPGRVPNSLSSNT